MDENPNGDIVRRTAAKYHRLFRSSLRTVLDPEDMAQEIALRLVSSGIFSSPERALVSLSAKAACLDVLRETLPGFRARDMQPPPRSIDDPDSRIEPAADRPSEEAAELRRAYMDRGGPLDSREREVLRGQIEGLTQAEIAGRLGISQQRVWAIRQGAIGKLRQKFLDP